jgi:hypothetical protein
MAEPWPGRSFRDRRKYIPVGFGKNIPVFCDPERTSPAKTRRVSVSSAERSRAQAEISLRVFAMSAKRLPVRDRALNAELQAPGGGVVAALEDFDEC